jgi:hypothetical protein
MVKSMHEIILKNIKICEQKFTFFAFSVDELMIINNQWWMNMHFLMMKNWVPIPILPTLE